MLRLRLVLTLALALSLAACAADRTAILVEVTSTDLAVPDDIDGLQFQASSALGSMADESYPIAGQWPHSLTIVPLQGERMGEVTITVTGVLQGAFVVRRTVTSAFEPGTTRRVTIDLSAACVGVMCPDRVDCRAGMCVGVEVDGGTPDGGADAGPLDAGEPLDAQVEDGGMIDGGSLDAGGMDAGSPDGGPGDAGMRDAGLDAGMRDARVDAPMPADAGPPGPGALVINEIDYDQDGTDTTEFVELVNTSASTVDLTNHVLYFVNGSSVPALSYGMVALSGSLAPGQYLVVGSTVVNASVPATERSIALTFAIQNGHPDGVVLWRSDTMVLVDALAYGASTLAPTLSASISGTTVELVDGAFTPARDSTTAVRSVCRVPSGSDTHDDATDWTTCATPTPGLPNVP